MVKLPHSRRVVVLLALAAALLAFSSVAALAASDRSAKIGDDFFHPGRLTIDKGTKVTWNWKGYLNHNVHVKSGPSKFHSPPQVQGSFSHVFDRRGTYHLYCTIHPNMKETIVVR
jgi:plastocyanin